MTSDYAISYAADRMIFAAHGYMLLYGGTLFLKTLDGEACRVYRL